MPKVDETLDEIFTYHPPDDNQRLAYTAIRERAKELARSIDQYCPPGSDRTAAMRKLREAVMTANAAVALRGLNYS